MTPFDLYNDEVIGQFAINPEIHLSSLDISAMSGLNFDAVEDVLQKYYEAGIVTNICYNEKGYGYYKLNMDHPDIREFLEYADGVLNFI